MSAFHDRWTYNEKRVQTYIDLPDWEQALKDLNNEGKPAKAVSLTIPYTYATIATIVTYLIHTFAGRRPMFQVGSYGPEADPAQMMEVVLQFQADKTQLIRHLFQYFFDGEVYGVGVLKTLWREERAVRTVWKESPGLLSSLGFGSNMQRVRELQTTFQGNTVESIDPFMFFPDPRVPMIDVARKGEYVFWRSFVGKHLLRREQAADRMRWVDYVGKMPKAATGIAAGMSARGLISGGEGHPGQSLTEGTLSQNYVQADQGTCEIIPRELGLGPGETPEKWLFTLGNKYQILQAERFDTDHGMHPVAVVEPYTLGYGFGHAGMSDYMGPLQDTISWFLNSHIYNVRTALNNMFVVDPSRVEMQDLKNPDAGKIIRLKRAAYGSDVREIIQQLAVTDVTRGHVQDTELLIRLGDALSSVVDNLRGLQDSGGRKTATEVRTAGEAAASRLAAHARLESAQGITTLTEQMSLNTQQYLDQDFYLQIVGREGIDKPIHIRPEMLVGAFHFPVHDGTLPLDRVALLDQWKEIFLAVASDPELRAQFSVPEIFDYIAELGGAKNLDRFKIQIAPDQQVQQQAQAGNLVPTGESGQVNAVPARPGNRAAGAVQ